MSIRTFALAALTIALPLGAQRAAVPPTPPAPAVRPAVPTPPRAPLAAGFGDHALYSSSFGEERGIPEHSRFAQDPGDSTYREARTLLNRGEWRRAATLFASIAQRFPNSEYHADALYWQAFALYRIGGTVELREGLAALDARRTRFPNARSQSEATTLATRIRGALAARGDAGATAEIAREAGRGEAVCDAEELSVRASALSALMRADAAAAQSQLERVLARRDECSVPLRRNAVMMIGTKADAGARTRLTTVATTDPSEDVRVDAVGYLARIFGDEVVATLDQIVRGSDEERVKRAAVRALGDNESPRAKAAIRGLVERRDASERLRLEALGTFDRGGSWSSDFHYSCEDDDCSPSSHTPRAPAASGARPTAGSPTPAPAAMPRPAAAPAPPAYTPAPGVPDAPSPVDWPTGIHGDRVRSLSAEDATWLRNVYPRLETTRLKSRAASVLVRASDEATISWLMALVQNEEESGDVRSAVLARLGRNLSIAQLARLYDNASSRTVRRQLVSTLGERSEAAATDKLIEIVRSGTDPQLRRSAISALTRKNDPRTTQLLLEMIDR